MTTKLQRFCQELLPVIQAGANGARIGVATEPSGKLVEISIDGENDVIGFVFSRKYTVMRDMITVNGFEVPAGEKHKPSNDSEYFIPSVVHPYCQRYQWCGKHGDPSDQDFLNRGILYLNHTDAIARAKAMLGVDPYAVEQEGVPE